MKMYPSNARIGVPYSASVVLAYVCIALAVPSARAEVLEIFGGAGTVKNEVRIHRSLDADPTPEESLLTVTNHVEDLNVDVSGGKMYFIDGTPNALKRANLDGTSVETLVSSMSTDFTSVGLDLTNGKVYWGDQIDNNIQRANLNGTSVELVVTGIDEPTDIAIDPAGGKVYWVDFIDGELERANLNGTNVETIASGTPNLGPFALALDLGASKVYWTDGLLGIRRADLDGMNTETLIAPGEQGTGIPFSIALDLSEGKMYWTDLGDPLLRRANLDGTGVEEVHNPTLADFYLAIDTTSRTLYWSESLTSGTGIRRRTLPNVSTIVSGLTDVGGIDIHVTGGRFTGQVYYVETDTIEVVTGNGSIHRSNLDGSGDVELITGLTIPFALELDPDGGKMYWTDPIDGIFRADLAGTNVENIVTTGLPQGIALDLANGRVYWTDIGSPFNILRANLDGTNVQPVLSGLTNLWGLALHPGQGKIYWTRRTGGSEGIFRANLDGTDVETLLQNPAISDVQAIELDTAAGKMYFSGENMLRRASLDGSNVEVIFETIMPAIEFALVTTGGLNIFVDFAASGNQDGTSLLPFSSVQQGLEAVESGGSITFAGGSIDTDSNETPSISQSVTLQAVGGAVTIGSPGGREASPGTGGFVSRQE